ncbi:hypothetical protein LSH36_682g00019 [Paralvinella palmiformis]|uniref:N-acetyltransferase domain-containing protein n=1 Tax=Paralvinella palmiformis TaxID=53620 RepID=A0AAD9MVJ5_9ANNE|nr:hypothetical protein LSH36_682g00019 [Paralvinella palmiformis]
MYTKVAVIRKSSSSYAGSDHRRTLAGYALFYYVYSTFQGRSAYLEDFYVSTPYRGQCVGTRMLEKVAQIILEEGCRRLDFVVLKWNAEAAKLYKRLGAQDLSDKEQWHIWRLAKNQLHKLAYSSE